MKGREISFFVVLSALVLCSRHVAAQCSFASGSTGADGAFAPTADVSVPLAPDGIFNYTTVNIPSGVTVTFQRNAKNTPVFMLATGDVTIAGVIDVSGTDSSSPIPGKGGPGGFDGGIGGLSCGGAGLGPGGGGPTCPGSPGIGGGGFGTAGGSGGGGPVYGNAVLVPLIGGSGGGGGANGNGFGPGGGGGGGAILIASSGTIALTGSVRANGGTMRYGLGTGAGGSGGAIRLVASVITGNGNLSVNGNCGCRCTSMGCWPCCDSVSANGGNGRARLETCENRFTGSVPGALSFGTPAPVFVAVPTLSITSIGAVAAPAIPAGSFTLNPDISLPAGTTTATVQLVAVEIPIGTTVDVSVKPQYGALSTVTSTPLSGTQQHSTASADIPLSAGLTIVSAQTTVAVGQGAGPALVVGSLDGEPINKVRVAAVFGGASSLTYVTTSGREVAAW